MGVFMCFWCGYFVYFIDGYWLSIYREIMYILDVLLVFCVYFFIGVVMVIVFFFIYLKIMLYNEWQLIKNNNIVVLLVFSGMLLGYVIFLFSVVINLVSILDYFVWGGIVLVI